MSKRVSIFKRRSGAKASYEALMAPYVNGLYKQAYRYTGNESDAEDLLQDLLLDMYQKQDKLRAAPVPKAWLHRCLYNRFIDDYRKQQRQPESDAINNENVLPLASVDSPEADVGYQQIIRCMQQLSPAQRMVVSLHDIEGYTLVELAQSMDMPLGTLKSHLHRARKVLKQQFDVQPFEGGARY